MVVVSGLWKMCHKRVINLKFKFITSTGNMTKLPLLLR